MSLIARLAADEGGQDIVEYALLTAVVGLAGLAAFPLIVQAMNAVYVAWNTATNALWETPPPGASGT